MQKAAIVVIACGYVLAGVATLAKRFSSLKTRTALVVRALEPGLLT
jgi:hypothetical protein